MAKRPCSEVEGIRTDGAGCSTQALATSTVQLAAMLAAQGSLLRSGDPWYVSVFLRNHRSAGPLSDRPQLPGRECEAHHRGRACVPQPIT